MFTTHQALLDQAPQFDTAAAEALALQHYGWQAQATPLPSERDQNFLLHTTGGERFVLKIANAHEQHTALAMQQAVLGHLAGRLNCCPRVMHTLSGATLTEAAGGNAARHLVWAISYLPGKPLGHIGRRSPALLEDLGRSVGALDRALADFDHPSAHREFHWDLAHGLAVVRQHRAMVADPALGAQIDQLIGLFEQHTAPLLPRLRRSAIHNDLNDYNVLVGGEGDLYTRDQRVVGLVDFGDMVHSYTVGDLAIAAAYALLDAPDPLATAAAIVRGYHQAYRLEEAELGALFGLIGLRLCVSACIAAFQQSQQPGNQYLGVSQGPIRRTLPLLARTPFRLAEAIFRDACGLPPIASSPRIEDWLRAHGAGFAPVLDHDLRGGPSLVLDLSVGSPLIGGDARENAEPKLTERVFGLMRAAGAPVSVGRYDEPRLIYTEPMFATGPRVTDERRAVHVGLDLFAEAGTPVYAPLDGSVHAFADNAAAQDYGPVIVLRHTTGNGDEFFTLYGHLSRASLEGLALGAPIKRGQRVGWMGMPAVNGGWTPHLHLQLITDDLELGADFPGVGRASQRTVWRSLSPDPNLLVGVPAERFPPEAQSKAATLAERRERIGRNLSIGYRDPLKIVRGWMQYLYDDAGQRYLDAYNNVPHVGHCHPRVVAAGQAQMSVLNTNTRYLHDALTSYAERLSATLPEPLRVCYFVNSASEANELALRLARAYTGQRDMIVLEAAYHGHTTGLIDISPYKHAGPGGLGAPGWVHTAPIPDDYRGAFKRGDPQAGPKYAAEVANVIARMEASGRRLAGFIAETYPSVGGQIIPPDGYLRETYRHVRAAGGVCIADEVQTGFGRTGTHFWAFEAQGAVPDIVVAGKPIGNGHPIGAVVTTRAIADAFDNGMEFFSTFGGSTVSCAVGLAVLDVLRDEGLQAHAQRVGERLLAGLRPLAARHPIIGDVRGAGLFLGVELVRDRDTLAPADAEASFVSNRMREFGILMGTDGPYHNVVKIRPPMPFSLSDADLLVERFAQILRESFA